ncbi:hypothetical protein V490_05578 [Pseudogymnoascus sp. VKM F-3557]|nr:hypothetical protein V490_05578 [Pseudogymnoascus sp. VKM F-3557]
MASTLSQPVDPSAIAASGCFTSLPLRKSNYEGIAVAASFDLFEEYNRLVREADVTKGVYDPRGHGVSFWYPECLPERIDLVTRMQDLGLIHDDDTGLVGTPAEAETPNHAVADLYRIEANFSPTITVTGDRAKKQIAARLFLQAIAFDRDISLDIFDRWLQRQELHGGARKGNEFQSLDEWVSYRWADTALKTTHEIGAFGAGVKISAEEKRAVEHIIRPVMMSVALSNDYYSYDKAYTEYVNSGGQNGVTNSVWVLMREHGVDKVRAKELLANKIKALEREYLAARELYENTHPNLSQQVKAWMDSAAFISSGTHYWSTYASRYNRPENLESAPVFSSGHGGGLNHSGSNLDNNTTPENETQTHGRPDGASKILSEQQEQSNILSQSIDSGYQSSICNDEKDRSFTDMTAPFTDMTAREIPAQTVLEPYEYLRAVGAKGVRHAAIEALHIWLDVPETSLSSIRNIVDYLHSSSLMLDDIQDKSVLHRGSPATHLLFGEAQTINSANFLLVESLNELQKLQHPQCTVIYNAQMRRLHVGKSMDLYWTRQVICPTAAEYIDMVDHKIGGLFNLAGGLMEAEGRCNTQLDLSPLMTLFGRYFQIRDDYNNVVSADYAAAKGFCEDLDKGRFTLLLIHALQIEPKQKHRLEAIMQERRHNGNGMSAEMKRLVLGILREAGSLEYVNGVLEKLQGAINVEIQRIEGIVGEKNYVMRLLLERLRIN